MNGLLYRGSKPVMWSVVEKTALAEAEVEYHDYQSDTVFVKFPVMGIETGDGADETAEQALAEASVIIWTTTPWTLPGNRAIAYSSKIGYGVYKVTAAPENNWAKVGDLYVLADKLAADVMKAAKVEAFEKVAALDPKGLFPAACRHPLAALGYQFDVPLLDGEHVTDDAGTGFVHTAPGHGREDFDIWTASARTLRGQDIDTAIPFTVDADGFLTKEAPGFEGKRVINDKGNKGDANDAVIKALAEAGAIISRGRLKHQYPHSWRSKKPVIFRNTPQWFIAMDKAKGGGESRSLRRSPRHHQGDRMGAEGRREPHHRHDRGKARLGAVAPARLGRADHRVRPQGHRRSAAERRQGARQGLEDADRPHHHRRWRRTASRPGSPLARAKNSSTASSTTSSRLGAGHRHSRCLVRIRLHPRLRAGRSRKPSRSLAGIKRQRDGGPTG